MRPTAGPAATASWSRPCATPVRVSEFVHIHVADLHLPLQAVDYWLRVRKHLMAGDFERMRYFGGVTIRREPPRILLVAPALEFHSTTESLTGLLKPEIEITRIGLAADWRRELRIVLRLQGAEKP